METANPAKTEQQQRGRFKAGQSGNPAGRPVGSRHKATLAVQALLEGEAEKIGRKAVELALAGDTTAMRLVLERIIPPRKENPIAIGLPPLTSVQDLPAVMQAIVAAVSEGSITPNEGKVVGDMIELWRKAIETSELESRITNLEKAKLK